MDDINKTLDDILGDMDEKLKVVAKVAIVSVVMEFVLPEFMKSLSESEKEDESIIIQTQNKFLYYKSPKEYIIVKR